MAEPNAMKQRARCPGLVWPVPRSRRAIHQQALPFRNSAPHLVVPGFESDILALTSMWQCTVIYPFSHWQCHGPSEGSCPGVIDKKEALLIGRLSGETHSGIGKQGDPWALEYCIIYR
jgi:hypothetical protein